MIIRRIAQSTGLNADYLRKVVRSASHRYKIYNIPKKTGGLREIAHPAAELKLLQRWLVNNIFSLLPVHETVYSYREGIGIQDLAKNHNKNKYLLRIDFADFFPSIKGHDIEKLLDKNAIYLPFALSKNDISTIKSIVCKDGCLTIGAPSSPAITNAILFDFDLLCHSKAISQKVVYTRYSDDIYYSTNKPDLLNIIYNEFKNDLKLIKSPKLKINDKKTVFSSMKNKRIVTGLMLTSEKSISVGRAKKRYIKSLIHKFVEGNLMEIDLSYLMGYLAYTKAVEPIFLKRLSDKYGKKVIQDIFKANIVSRK